MAGAHTIKPTLARPSGQVAQAQASANRRQVAPPHQKLKLSFRLVVSLAKQLLKARKFTKARLELKLELELLQLQLFDRSLHGKSVGARHRERERECERVGGVEHEFLLSAPLEFVTSS